VFDSWGDFVSASEVVSVQFVGGKLVFFFLFFISFQ